MTSYTGHNRTPLTFLKALYLPQGGLMLHAECEPDMSLANRICHSDRREESLW